MEDQKWDLVLMEMKRINHELGVLDGDMKEANGKLSDIRIEIAMLKVKASMWGAAAGLLPAIGLYILNALVGK